MCPSAELPDRIDDQEVMYARVKEYYSNPKVDLMGVMKDGVKLLVSVFDENPDILLVLGEFYCQVPRIKMIAKLNASLNEMMMRTTAIIIQEGTKRGIFKKRNPQVAAYTLISITVGFAFNHVINKGNLDSKKLEREFTDLVLGYLCK